MSTHYEGELEIVCVFEYCNLIYLLYVKSVLKINVYFHKSGEMNEWKDILHNSLDLRKWKVYKQFIDKNRSNKTLTSIFE